MQILPHADPEVADILAGELERQQWTLDMIAAENTAPLPILEAGASGSRIHLKRNIC
jgi:glycine hydroxymethyltransferase